VETAPGQVIVEIELQTGRAYTAGGHSRYVSRAEASWARGVSGMGAGCVHDQTTSRQRHRWPAWKTVGVALVAAMLAVIGFFVSAYALRSQPGPKSLNSVIRGFKEDTAFASVGHLRYPPPAAGVYRLQGKGSERISFPPTSQADGGTLPATVSYSSGRCWRWHVDYNVAHWEQYQFCSDSSHLWVVDQWNGQSWDFGAVQVTNVARLACTPATGVLPPDPTAGLRLHWTCTGVNSATSGRNTQTTTARIVSVGNLTIGHVTVRAVHEVQRTTVTGPQTGSAVENWWYSASSGLPLRMQREISIHSHSPVGTVTYTEAGSWQMASLKPHV